MKKKLILLGICLIMLSGCGKEIPKLSNGDEAVVSLENGTMVSANELYEKMKESNGLTSLLAIIDKNILEDKYKDNLEEAKATIQSTKSMQMQLYSAYGYSFESEDKFVQALGFPSVEAYEEEIYLSYLQDLAIEDYAKEQISEKEIKKYYENEVSGDFKVSHILIAPEVTDDMSEEDKKAAEATAKATAQSIIDELKKTESDKIEERFAELVKEFSQDEATKENGGSLGFINKGTLGSNYTDLENAAFDLKDGEFSKSVITSSYGYHVILRVESKEKGSLEDLKDSILDTLSAELLDSTSDKYDATLSIKALQELRKDYGIEFADPELKEDYANYIQNQLASAQQEEK